MQSVTERKLCGLLLVGEVSIPSSDDVAIHLRVFKVAAFECIDLPFQVHQRFLKQTEHVIKMGQGTEYESQTTAFNRQYPKKVKQLCLKTMQYYKRNVDPWI